MKKLVSMLLCLCLVLSLTAFAAAEGYTAGTYEGKGAGRNGDIVVQMTVKAGKIAYRNMTSRWGSCQPSTGRICINVRLALYPPECLEYVVVHELCHLLERGHGPRFHALMDTFMPDWKERLRAS